MRPFHDNRPTIMRERRIAPLVSAACQACLPRQAVYALRARRYRALVERLAHERNTFPHRINLSLAAVCQARCIFCPTARGTRIKPKFMSVALAKKIFDDAHHEGYAEMFKFSENGESLLNKDFETIFAYFRSVFPKNPAVLITNAELLDDRKAAFLLTHNLTGIVVNMDGATKETYEQVKVGLSFDTVRQNILHLIALRDQCHKPFNIGIQVLSARRYLQGVKRAYRHLRDDTKDVINYWYPRLSRYDSIRVIEPFFWAEKDSGRYDKRVSPACKLFERVARECYIAPNGDVYICCLDYNAELVLGNMNDQTIRDVWNGSRRKEILELFRQSRFDKIGKPCFNCV